MDNKLQRLSSIWSVICRQPGIGVVVYDAFGVCRFINEQARKMCLVDDSIDPVGKTMEETEGTAFAHERIGIILQVITMGQPVTVRQICNGLSTEASYWLTGKTEEGTPLVLMIARYTSPSDDPAHQHPVVESKFVDLGPLNCLTDAELHVLALIRKGWPLKRIASELATPMRTIENRRASIGKKLRAKSLVELAEIAHNAGLQPRHTNLTRVERPSMRQAVSCPA